MDTLKRTLLASMIFCIVMLVCIQSTLADSPVTGNVVVNNLTTSQPVRLQLKSFYAEGRLWLFYIGDTHRVLYTSSTDGITWETPTDHFLVSIGEDTGENVAIALDSSNKVHVLMRSEYWDFGTPYANGTIIWTGTIDAPISPDWGTSIDPYLALDSSGHDWVMAGYGSSIDDITISAIKNKFTNGSWSSDPQITIAEHYTNLGAVPLLNEQMYFYYFRTDQAGIYGKVWNGTSLGEQETITDNTAFTDWNSGHEGYGRSIISDELGNIYFAYVNDDYNLCFTERDAETGTWSDPITIQSWGACLTYSPCLSLCNGTLSVYYIYNDTHIASRTLLDGAWTDPTFPIQANGTNSIPSSYYMGFNGRLNSFGSILNGTVALYWTEENATGQHSIMYAGLEPSVYYYLSTIAVSGTVNTTSGWYSSGETAVVSDTPSTGFVFSYFILDGATYTENPISVSMTADHILVAYNTMPPPPIINITLFNTNVLTASGISDLRNWTLAYYPDLILNLPVESQNYAEFINNTVLFKNFNGYNFTVYDGPAGIGTVSGSTLISSNMFYYNSSDPVTIWLVVADTSALTLKLYSTADNMNSSTSLTDIFQPSPIIAFYTTYWGVGIYVVAMLFPASIWIRFKSAGGAGLALLFISAGGAVMDETVAVFAPIIMGVSVALILYDVIWNKRQAGG